MARVRWSTHGSSESRARTDSPPESGLSVEQINGHGPTFLRLDTGSFSIGP